MSGTSLDILSTKAAGGVSECKLAHLSVHIGLFMDPRSP